MIQNGLPQLSSELETFIKRIPKIELHLHLEGSITPKTLLRIAQRNKVNILAHDEAEVARHFNYRDFHEFLSVFMVMSNALRYGEDFEEVAYALAEQLHEQNVCYSEIMLSPALYYRRGMNLDEVVQGTAAGLARAAYDFGIRTQIAFDYGRQFGSDMAWPILEAAIRGKPYGLVAWSIGGDEVNYPPEMYADVFKAAREAGLHTMAHAGEVAGAASVRGAVLSLGVERIGHGIRSVDDPEVLALLRQQHVTVDVCPSSNVLTGAVHSFAKHPLRQMFDAGLQLTLNSDDPVFFQTNITQEYHIAAQVFGFSATELVTLTRNAAKAAFIPEPEKESLLHYIDTSINELGALTSV